MSAATACSPAAADVQAAPAEIRRDFEARLRAKIDDAIGAGVLPRETGAEALALLYTPVVQGMSAPGARRREPYQAAGAGERLPSGAGEESG